jgi:hypothetical protein
MLCFHLFASHIIRDADSEDFFGFDIFRPISSHVNDKDMVGREVVEPVLFESHVVVFQANTGVGVIGVYPCANVFHLHTIDFTKPFLEKPQSSVIIYLVGVVSAIIMVADGDTVCFNGMVVFHDSVAVYRREKLFDIHQSRCNHYYETGVNGDMKHPFSK